MIRKTSECYTTSVLDTDWLAGYPQASSVGDRTQSENACTDSNM
jgi:hypothetical protein